MNTRLNNAALNTFTGLADWLHDWQQTNRAETRIGLIHALGHVPYPDDTKLIDGDSFQRIDACITQANELEPQISGQEQPDFWLGRLASTAFKFALSHLSTMRHNHEQMRETHAQLVRQGKACTGQHEEEELAIQQREVKLLELLQNAGFMKVCSWSKELPKDIHKFLEQIRNEPKGSPFVSWYQAAVLNGSWDLLPAGDQRSIEALKLHLALSGCADQLIELHRLLRTSDYQHAAIQYLKHLTIGGKLLTELAPPSQQKL